MPSPSSTPFAMQQSQLIYPALCFYPLNDSFVPKYISLQGGQRVKIGRQTNAKTIPGERNGYFDSKVLSRQHAEVWEENGKIYLKDVKSSNGTFVNGERLSGEALESDPFELKTDDLVVRVILSITLYWYTNASCVGIRYRYRCRGQQDNRPPQGRCQSCLYNHCRRCSECVP